MVTNDINKLMLSTTGAIYASYEAPSQQLLRLNNDSVKQYKTYSNPPAFAIHQSQLMNPKNGPNYTCTGG